MYQADNDLRRYFENNPGRLLHKWLHYFEIYDHHFSRYRDKPVNILEIGIFHGGSIQLWKDYFGPQATIYAVDVDPRCKQFEEENVRVFIGDQADRDFLRKLKEEIPRPDILIDDGGHLMHQQITTFEELYPFVADDGIYLCEDIHTSYHPKWGGGLLREGTFVEYAKRLVDSLNAYHTREPDRYSPDRITRSAHSMHFYDSVFVIEKLPRDCEPVDAKTGLPVFPENNSPRSTPLHLLKPGLIKPQDANSPESNTRKFTWTVLTSYQSGSPQVEERLFQALGENSSKFAFVYGGWSELGSNKYTDSLIHEADGYALHGRFPHPNSADVLEHIFSSGKPVIYFFEEAMPELPSGELRTQSGFRKYIIDALKLSHMVIVENEAQKECYKSLNSRMVVLPQKLSANQCHPRVSQESPLKIIYRGDDGHLENLLMISEALKQSANQQSDKIEFHFFGHGLAALGEHPAFHIHPPVTNQAEWVEDVQRINPDIALMPLQDVPGHELTTVLPLLEYAAMEIPVIASNLMPYRAYLMHGQNGLLTENETGTWLAILESCIGNREALAKLGRQSRDWFESEHQLNGNNQNLENVLELGISNAASARPGKPPVDFMRLNEKTIYQKWLPNQRLKPRDILWMQEELANWDQRPHFHLLMTLLPSQAQWLPVTLDSLVTQINPDWKLSIIAFTPQPSDFVHDGRIHWYEVGDDEDSYDALNRLAQDAGSDWVGFIEAGDVLPPQAFFKLGLYARNNPKWQIIYTDEDQINAESYRSNPLFKPDYNPDLLHAYPYTGGLCLFDRTLYSAIGGVNPEKDGAEVYDLLLRCTEQLLGEKIGHLAEILYTRFDRGGHSVRSLAEISQSLKESLIEHFDRRGIHAEVKAGPYTGTHVIAYPMDRTPLVSILIPTRDHLELIKPCIDSLLEKTDYPNYEVLVLNNDSQDSDVLEYFDQLRQNPKIRILDYPHPFNFSAICNYGNQQAKGEFLLLLNNDTEITQNQWLSEMVRHGLRPEVGIVGARLLFPDGTLQHAGVVMGIAAIADHPFISTPPSQPGYMMRAQLTQNYSAITAACMLIKKDLYDSVNGMDEQELKVLFNDVDLCLKVRESGFKVVWTPAATLTHKASVSIKSQQSAAKRHATIKRVLHEQDTMTSRWLEWMAHDPAYNRNLSLTSKQFSQEEDIAQGYDPLFRPVKRILAFPADSQGCGEYRVIAPCRALSEAGLAQTHTSTSFYWPNQLYRINPDAIVMQRPVEEAHYVQLDAMRRHSKAFRLFEIDDLLHNLPDKSVHRNAIQGDELERIAEGISLCDRLITTSSVLADVYGKFCKDVKIVPNYLERAKWDQLQPMRIQRKKPRVGWGGGASHTGDLEMMYPVIKALHKEVDWIFFGMCPEQLRPFIHEFHRPAPIDSYPAKLASLNLDLALAPLEYNHFNEAKSPLRILEYGILGYPVISTDILCYQGDFPITRVSNDPNEWIEAILHLISDRDALAVQGNMLRKHIQDHWMLEDNLDKWLESWLP